MFSGVNLVKAPATPKVLDKVAAPVTPRVPLNEVFPLESIVAVFVSTPVSVAVLNTVTPFSDRTLPLKVVLAM